MSNQSIHRQIENLIHGFCLSLNHPAPNSMIVCNSLLKWCYLGLDIPDSAKFFEHSFKQIGTSQRKDLQLLKIEKCFYSLILGKIHFNLKNYSEAIEKYMHYLSIKELLQKNPLEHSNVLSSFANEQDIQSAYFELFYAYEQNRDYKKIVENYEISKRLGIIFNDAETCIRIGNAYWEIEKEIQEAICLFEKAISIAKSDKLLLQAHGTLGTIYQKVEHFEKSISHYKKALKFATNNSDKTKIISNLAIIYLTEWRNSRRQDCWDQGTEYMRSWGELFDEESTSNDNVIERCRMAQCLFIATKYKEALSLYDQIIKSYELDDETLATSYLHMGTCWLFFKEHNEPKSQLNNAIEFFNKSKELFERTKNLPGIGCCFNNIARAFVMMDDYESAEGALRQSLEYVQQSDSDRNLNLEANIAVFQENSKTYLQLEEVLVLKGNCNEALLLSDTRRGKALCKKIVSKSNAEKLNVEIRIDDILDLAQTLNTTFVIYSFAFLDDRENHRAGIWTVSSKGQIERHSFVYDLSNDELKQSSTLLKSFPYICGTTERKRFRSLSSEVQFLENLQIMTRGDQSSSNSKFLDSFHERLSNWYETLIAPIEKYLPKDPEQVVTIIPDGFLFQLPFAAFKDKDGKYLIEKHSLCMAPSVKVLKLLNEMPKEFPKTSIVIGNPTTASSKDVLPLSEKEAKEIVAPLLETKPEHILTQKKPTVSRFMQVAPQASFIHLACHGITEEKMEDKPDPHSLFSGLFKLASDEKDSKGYLHAETISSLSLHTNLVFMSACYSGRGRLQREGVIGPVWSFLAAGALSSVATHWRLPESELTLKIVETFYRHFLGKDVEKLNKAQALRRAVLEGIEKERNKPHLWGAFFLSGLLE